MSIKNGGYVGCAPVMVKRDTSLMLARRVVKAEFGGLSVIWAHYHLDAQVRYVVTSKIKNFTNCLHGCHGYSCTVVSAICK